MSLSNLLWFILEFFQRLIPPPDRHWRIRRDSCKWIYSCLKDDFLSAASAYEQEGTLIRTCNNRKWTRIVPGFCECGKFENSISPYLIDSELQCGSTPQWMRNIFKQITSFVWRMSNNISRTQSDGCRKDEQQQGTDSIFSPIWQSLFFYTFLAQRRTIGLNP